MLKLLIVGASGGLGSTVTREALARGHAVSVLVRNADKLRVALGDNAPSVSVHVGDGSDMSVLSAAANGVDAIIATGPPDAALARAVGDACVHSSTCRKVVWTAGGSEVREQRIVLDVQSHVVWRDTFLFICLGFVHFEQINEADGKTPHYLAFGAMGNSFHAAHGPCVDSVIASGAKYIIWCPGRMTSRGSKSSPPVPILTHAPPRGASPMDFVSYEDSADVILRAVESTAWDNMRIAAVTNGQTTGAAPRGEL